MRIKVDVTREDIRKGQPCSARRCPVALATKRALTNASGLATLAVAVGSTYLDIEDDDGELYSRIRPALRLPRVVSRFTEDYDMGDVVKPFSFWLEV